MASVSPQLSRGSFNGVRAWVTSFVHHALQEGMLEGVLQNDACQSLSSVSLRGIVLSKLLKVWPRWVQVTW